jgi:L-serine dehydratase
MARDLMDGDLSSVLVEYDPSGSLATTHDSQGSDMGLFAGLLGWEAWDERLVASTQAIRQAGIRVEVRLSLLEARHPNTYRLTLENEDERHRVTAISNGGGMVEVIELDGVGLSIRGDYHETLLYLNAGGDRLVQELEKRVDVDYVLLHQEAEAQLVEVKSQHPLPREAISQIQSAYGVHRVKTIPPVLPVLSRRDIKVPFLTCAEMLAYNDSRDLDLWELAIEYESARANLSHEQVLAKMHDLVRIMRDAILDGISGTAYADRILGHQSGAFEASMQSQRLLDAGLLNHMILYVTALMEAKSAMQVIVAAPTAGACGGLPGACIGASSAMGLSEEDTAKAMLAAGVIGVFIAARATFAAEVGGCQAECGAGSGMAAAALVTLAGGTARQATDAASMALQNTLGLICDPVANRVEVPCLGRNVLAASNALACANMALAGFDAVISLDEVIETMDRVGKSLPRELRCTALGGLSITLTSKRIAARLSQQAMQT